MIFLLILMLSLAYAQEFEGCAGAAADPSCDNGKDSGHDDEPGCDRNANPEMWYYNGNSCVQMEYFGCGGNRNRYCSEVICRMLCARFLTTESSIWIHKIPAKNIEVVEVQQQHIN